MSQSEIVTLDPDRSCSVFWALCAIWSRAHTTSPDNSVLCAGAVVWAAHTPCKAGSPRSPLLPGGAVCGLGGAAGHLPTPPPTRLYSTLPVNTDMQTYAVCWSNNTYGISYVLIKPIYQFLREPFSLTVRHTDEIYVGILFCAIWGGGVLGH